MSYVIEYLNERNEIKYYLNESAGVYCPENAARYSNRKSALTVAESVFKRDSCKFLRVVELSYDLIAIAHKRYYGIADEILYPDNFR